MCEDLLVVVELYWFVDEFDVEFFYMNEFFLDIVYFEWVWVVEFGDVMFFVVFWCFGYVYLLEFECFGVWGELELGDFEW